MNTRTLLGLSALILTSSANGALYNLSDEDLLEGGTTAMAQPFISSTPAVIINDALFQRGAANSGSGTFRDLVRFDGDNGQPNGFDSGQHAYNRETDNTTFQDSFIGQEDGIIQVQDMVLDSTGDFYVFRLDINNEGFTSVDQIRLWTDPNETPGGVAENPNNYTDLETALGIAATLVYDLDAGGDNTIFLNSDDSPGSGASDMAFFIPVSKFNTADPEDYVIFYAQMNAFDESTVGGLTEDDGTTVVDISSKNGNHESFAVPTQENAPVIPIPEPGSISMVLLAAAIGIGRRKRS